MPARNPTSEKPAAAKGVPGLVASRNDVDWHPRSWSRCDCMEALTSFCVPSNSSCKEHHSSASAKQNWLDLCRVIPSTCQDSINLPIVKTQRKQQRRINSISTGRWTAYVAAAAASSFAGAGSAEAEIHYSGEVFIKLIGNARSSLPLSNGASLVFEKTFQSTFFQNFHFLMKGVISGSGRSYFYDGYHRAFLSNLPSGENVSAGRFNSVAGKPVFGVLIHFFSCGAFSPIFGPNRGFVGFRFNTGNGTQYGWARIETRAVGIHRRVHAVIKDYAWGDVGDAILAGQKHSFQPANANSVPSASWLLEHKAWTPGACNACRRRTDRRLDG
jgi:hypothetical protein